MLNTDYQKYIHASRYARWDYDKGRRENWKETVHRFLSYFNDKYNLSAKEYKDIEDNILNLKVMPSMRALMSAGKALDRDNIAGYNCSALPVDSPRSFDEAMYILMCGTGDGFSVERQFINRMPEVAEELHETDSVIVVGDSKIGWASALRELISLLYAGKIPKWDVSKVRPSGATLKVFGGRASGPGPLVELFTFVVNTFKGAKGRKLNSLECHDIMCKVGEVVVVGGVRRCLPANAMVQTSEGNKYIKDISVGEFIQTGGRRGKVVGKAETGIKHMLDIQHMYGTLTCTPDHKVAVFVNKDKISFIKAKNLTKNSILAWDSVGYKTGTNMPFPAITEKKHFNSKKVCTPALVNSDVAWLVGLIHGDGYISDKGIEITAAKHERGLLVKANRVFDIFFNISGKISAGHGNCLRLRINSSALARLFNTNIKEAKTTLRIPSFIYQSTQEVRWGYLSGLFDSDGRSRTDGVIEQATTVYKEFSEDIVSLLHGLGIGCTVYNGSRALSRGQGIKAQDFYSILITGITNRRKWIINTRHSSSGKRPNKFPGLGNGKDFKYPKKFLGISSGWRNKITLAYAMDNNIVSKDIKYYPLPIVSIEDAGEELAYDIEVEGTNSFTSSGVLVHNSAMISLSNLTDDRMRNAKTGQWWVDNKQRALSNNSVAYTEKPEIGSFMSEWLSLYNSKSGERGIFNRVSAKKIVERNGRRDPDYDFLTNPCQPGFASVLTPEGIRTFDDIDTGSMIWSGKNWTRVVHKEHTGVKDVYEYTTSYGRFIGTENHRILQNGERREVKDADSIDISVCEVPYIIERNSQAIMDGLVIGDGMFVTASNLIVLNIGSKDEDYFDSEVKDLIKKERLGIGKYAHEIETTITGLPRTYDRTVPPQYYRGKLSDVLGFLRGLYSANGSVCGGRVTLKQSSYSLIKQVQEMLSSVGIKSYITTNKPKIVHFSNGDYNCKESYDLNITTDKLIFKTLIGFIQKYKMDKIPDIAKTPRKTSGIITRINYLGKFPVYDITVEADEHTYWTGGCLVSNCSEIILRPFGLCNLSEVVIRPEDTLEDLKEKVRVATIIGTMQSGLTNFRYLRRIWKRNAEEEALLGVSLTGIMDHPVTSGLEGKEILREWLSDLKEVAISTNKKYAKRFGVNESVAITCVKPSGTVSQLVNSASGIHARFSKYYIRRVRANYDDPVTRFMIDAGIPNEPEVNSPDTTVVFSFPMKSPEGSICVNDVKAIPQLEHWKLYQEAWCEHKPSVTIYVEEDEWMDVGAWVYENFDYMSGVSFLPKSDHVYQQAPYEEISEEEYNRLTNNKIELSWDSLSKYEKEDMTTGSQEYACVSGACEI